MFLTDIAPETPINIILNYEKETMEFQTNAVRSVEGGLLVEPMKKNGIMINFVQKPNFLYQLTFVNDEESRLYKWNKVIIKAVKDKEGVPYHMIISELEGQPHNRRQSYRVPVDIDGVARFGPNRMTHKVLIKDISSGGIGFECEKDVDCPADMMIHLSFEDRVLHTSFKVDCQSVRKEFNEERQQIFYGCRFPNESMAINTYVQRKQQRLVVKNNQRYRR